MCGGDLDIQPGKKIAECMYCGSMQTVPNIDDERRANLFARAGQFRLNGEFDKAMAVYDEILRDDTTDAEAHWSMVLCKYGIDYVQDPKTRRRVPTVNRMQYTSVFEDTDYIETIKYADASQKEVYEIEANAIENIRNGILEISKKEKPFDIFISYKETDSLGRRTEDSVYAYDIYEKLTAEGYRVFFSRVTLESVVGTAYEPYIFAALNSAKVMLVVGTSAENMNSVWVRNEWSRFLLLMQQDKSKSLIPIYKDMNPYDLPAEFSYLQAQDANRIGFMQDIIRGIGKIIGTSHAQESQSVEKSNDVKNNIKRAKLALEDRNWEEAKKFCERLLDSDAENGYAYLLLFMASEKVSSFDEVVAIKKDIEKNKDFEKAVRYSNGDVADKIQVALVKRKELENQQAYSEASKYLKGFHPIKKKKAVKSFAELGDYKDSALQKEKMVALAKRDKRSLIAIVICAFIVVVGTCGFIKIGLPELKYRKATKLFENEQYAAAEAAFKELGEYKDSEAIKEKAYIFDVSTDASKEAEFLELDIASADDASQEVIAEGIRKLISENKLKQAETMIERYKTFKSVLALADELVIENINELLDANHIDEAIKELGGISELCPEKQEIYGKCFYMKAKKSMFPEDIVLNALKANGYEDSEDLIKQNGETALRKWLESGELKKAAKLIEKGFEVENIETVKELCEEYKKYDVDIFVEKQGDFKADTTVTVRPMIDLKTMTVSIGAFGFPDAFDGEWIATGDKIEINYSFSHTYSFQNNRGEPHYEQKGFINIATGEINIKYSMWDRLDDWSYHKKYVATGKILGDEL